jgi:pyruvate dehydrogenase (quinone)
VTWEQRVLNGDPEYKAAQELPDFPYARYADSIGLRGIRVDKPEQIAGAWDRALESDRPVVLEAYVDPDVPPLPPHISLEQARNFSEAILKGDPKAAGILGQSIKGMVERLKPHKS